MEKELEARLSKRIGKRLDFMKERLEEAGWGLSDEDDSIGLNYVKAMDYHPDDPEDIKSDFDCNVVGLTLSVTPKNFARWWNSFGVQNLYIDLEHESVTPQDKRLLTFDVQAMASFLRKAEDELLEAGVPFSKDYPWFIADKEAKILKNQKIRKEMGIDDLEELCWKCIDKPRY